MNPRPSSYKKNLLSVILSFCMVIISTSLYAIDQQVDIRTNIGLSNGNDGEAWPLLGSVYGRYTLQSDASDDIKGVLSLDANAGDYNAVFGVYRAYVKARIGDKFRLTVGKAPITWGEGVYYNAGDVLFDSSNTGIILSSDEIRANANFLVDSYFVLGRYSYFEITGVAPTLDYYNPINQPTYKDASAGWRLGTKLSGVAIQAGGFYLGDKNYYSSFLTIQDGILGLFDCYFDTRVSTGSHNIDDGNWQDTWEMSAGIYYNQVIDNGIFTVRLESIFRPFKSWSAVDNPNFNENKDNLITEDDLGNNDYYGNEIYFEVGGNVTSYLSIFMRNVFSPIDLSDDMSYIISYTPVDKFTLSLNTGFQIGSKEDLFAFNRAGGFICYLQGRYLFG